MDELFEVDIDGEIFEVEATADTLGDAVNKLKAGLGKGAPALPEAPQLPAAPELPQAPQIAAPAPQMDQAAAVRRDISNKRFDDPTVHQDFAKAQAREQRLGFGGFEQNLADVKAENSAPLPDDASWLSKGFSAAQSALGTAADVASFGAFGRGVDQLTAVKRSFVDPVVEANQDAALRFYEANISDKMSSTVDFHARTLGKLFLGAEAYSTKQATERAREVVNGLEQTLGTTGAGFYQALLHSMGDLPLMLVGSQTLAARAAKGLGAVPGAVAYGAAENAAASLGTPGSNLKTDLLLGGAIGGGVAGAAKGAQKAQSLFDFRPEADQGIKGAFREPFTPAEASPGDKTPAGIKPTEGQAVAVMPGDKLNDSAQMFKTRPLGRPKQAMVYVVDRAPDGTAQYTKIGPNEAGELVQQPYDGLPSKIDAPLLATTDGRSVMSRGGWSSDLTDKAQREAFENWRNNRRLLDATAQDAVLTEKHGELLPPAPLKVEDGNLVEVSEGSQIILIDGNKKVSMVRSHSHEGRRAIARLSPIVEVQMPDGSRRWGKLAESDGAPGGERVVMPLETRHPAGIATPLVTTEASILRRTNELDPSSPAFVRTNDIDSFVDGFMLMSPEGKVVTDVPARHPLHNRRIALDNPRYDPDGTLVGGKVRVMNRAGPDATYVDFYWDRNRKKGPSAGMTGTFEGYKGRGIANAAYDYIEKLTGGTMYPSEVRLEGGYALWEKRNAQRAKDGLLPLEPHHNIIPDPNGVDLFADHSAPPPPEAPPPVDPPPPPPAPPPGPMPEEVGTGLYRLPNHDAKKRVFDAVSRMVSPDFARGPMDLVNEVVNNRAAKSLEDTAPAIVKSLRQKLGDGLTKEQMVKTVKGIKDLIDGTISPADFSKLFPEMASRAQDMVDGWKTKVTQLRQQIADMGGYADTSDSVAMQDVLRRLQYEKPSLFFRDLNPERNAQLVAKDQALMDKAMREVMDTLPAEMPTGRKRTEAQRLINEFIGNPNNGASVIENFRMRWLGTGTKRAQAKLMQGKTDVRVELDILRETLKDVPLAGTDMYGTGVVEGLRNAIDGILAKTDQAAVDAARKLVERRDFRTLPPPVQAAVKHVANTDPLTSTLRKLLGETEDGILAMGHEIAKLTGDVARLEMWQVIGANPEFVPPPEAINTPEFQQAVANGEFELVPDNLRHEVGNLAGKYVRRDVWEALRVLPDEQSKLQQGIQHMLRWMRFNKTVGNPGTWATNLFGNTSGLYMSGMSPAESARAVRESHRAWREYAKNPLADTLHADIHRKFIQYSLADSDVAKGLLGMTDRSLHNALDAELTKHAGDLSPLEAMEKLQQVAHSTMQKAGNAVRLGGAAYGALDVWPKAMAFWGSLERAGFTLDAGAAKSLDSAPFDPAKATQFLMEQGATHVPRDPKMLRRYAMNEAARNVMSSFQMFNRLPPAQRALGAGADILTGGFATSAAELMRIWATWPKRAMANPQARMKHGTNMLKWGVVMGSAYGALKAGQHAAGITDEELEDSKQRLSLSERSFHNGAVATPIRDAKGDPIWIDVSDMIFWPAQLMQGVEGFGLTPGQFSFTQAAGRIVGNAGMSLVGGEHFQRMLSQFGMADAPFQNDRMSPAEQVLRTGIVPVGLMNAFKGGQEAGLLPGRPRQLGTPPGAVVGAGKALLGGRVMSPSESQGPVRAGINYDYNRAIDEARRIQSGRARQGLGDMLFPRNPEQIRQEAQDQRNKRNQ